MTVKKHTAEGWTDGDAITALAGSGSGTQLDTVSVASGGSLTARNAAAISGSVGIRAVVGGTAAAVTGSLNNQTGTSTALMGSSFRLKIPSGGFPQSVTPLRGMNTGESGQRWRVMVNTSGTITFGGSAYTGTSPLATSASTYNNKNVRLLVIAGGSTSANWTFKIFDLAVSDSVAAETFSGSGANLGGPIQVTRGWVAAASGTTLTVDGDNLAVSDDGSDPDLPATATVSSLQSGGVGSTSATVVVIGANITNARVKFATNTALTANVVFSSSQAVDSYGVSHHAVTGLTTGTQYYYGVEADGVMLNGGTYMAKFRTAPDPTSVPASILIVGGSCQITDSDPVAYSQMAALDPDLILQYGDLDYRDMSNPTLTDVVNARKSTLNGSNVQSALRAAPFEQTPDNHDYLGDHSYSGSLGKQSITDGFREVFASHTLSAGDGIGLWRTFSWGKHLRVIILDTRTQRDLYSNPDGPSKTMLGTDQKAWLTAQLDQPEPIILIVSSIMWRTGGTTNDRWGSYRDEFIWLKNQIQGRPNKRVGVISGDRHAVGFTDGTHGDQDTYLPNWLAGCLNQGSEGAAVGETWDNYYDTGGSNMQSFGEWLITDSGSSVNVRFRAYTTDGTMRFETNTVFSIPSTLNMRIGRRPMRV